MSNDFSFLVEASVKSLTYHAALPIDQWAEQNVLLPSNTSEPGYYNASRAPYQRQIMRDMSPSSPVRKVILVWGSQTGKTTSENMTMLFYMKENPAPIGFGFSDDGNLKNYVKHKFDPLLESNPTIKQILKASGGKGTGDALDSKTFSGGFIKFFSGKSAAALRSDSFMVVIGDELDEWGLTKDGDPVKLIEKRTNTYGDRAKICLSSTPKNISPITKILKESTFNKYFVPCPSCGKPFSLEMEYFNWAEADGIIQEAWFECPHCHNIVKNEDKLFMLPKGRWMPTNEKADSTNQGYYLPSFYAPVGWISWKTIAQEYYDACLTPKGVDYDKMTVFCNTILAIPYVVGSESQDGKLFYDKSLESHYKRGSIPTWVNFLTTGSDVQGNRIETTLMGWGFRGRHLVIDHYVFMLDKDEDIESLDNQGWIQYRTQILNGSWEREDGLVMKTLANGLDRSYKPDTISAFYISLTAEEKGRFYPVRGYERMAGFVPSKKFVKSEGLTDAAFWDVPVNNIKHQVYDHLKLKDNAEGTVAFMPFYPSDFDQEFFLQLFSECEVEERGKTLWKKNRDRNEILDTHVYNYGMFYLIGLGGLKDEDWNGIAESQKEIKVLKPVVKKRRALGGGLEI